MFIFIIVPILGVVLLVTVFTVTAILIVWCVMHITSRNRRQAPPPNMVLVPVCQGIQPGLPGQPGGYVVPAGTSPGQQQLQRAQESEGQSGQAPPSLVLTPFHPGMHSGYPGYMLPTGTNPDQQQQPQTVQEEPSVQPENVD